MKARYKASCAIAAILSGWASASIAADSTTAATSTAVEEIVVTAQRRDESVENVPLTVQAFTGQTLTTFNVLDLQDLLKFTPNVSYGNNGPGQGNIFMRGLSAGFAGNQSSATAGNFPNVALYLDEESMQFPARNVDIYVVDMDRIEVLEGPQGTLFGGGAEAGALRYITNKPKLDLFEGNAEASYGFTAHGDPNAMGNVTLNIPLVQDKLALRVVSTTTTMAATSTTCPAPSPARTRPSATITSTSCQRGGCAPTTSRPARPVSAPCPTPRRPTTTP